MRIVRANGTVDKDVTYGYGSDGKLSTVLYPGGTIPYTYTYDFMDRPVKMTGPGFVAGNLMDQVKDVAYGVAGQVTSMKYLQGETEDYGSGSLIGVPYFFEEIKDFDPLYQMTRQRTTGRSAQGVFGTTLTDIEYVFPATGNNGRISRRKNNISGQDVSYGYDALNRLAGATNSGSGAWAQTFKHDGFGNLREQDATAGVAPDILLDVNMSNNRMSSAGWGYDANGNTTSMPVLGGGTATMGYDVDNRLVTWFKGTVGTEEYRYLPDNKRVWKKAPNGTETVYYYGAGGQKLATYTVQASPFALLQQSANVYFGGKLIRADGLAVVHDRLGSVMLQNGVQKDYFPYGDEIGTATAGNVDKFGTYHRDQTTGLDYADQRYYAGLSGRFLSSDPYESSGGSSEPGSWNRYPYVGGDPINANDPSGLLAVGVGGGGGVVYDLGVFFRALGLGFLIGGNSRALGDPNWQTDAQVGAITAAREKTFWKQVSEDSEDQTAFREPSYLRVVDDCYVKPYNFDPNKDWRIYTLTRRRRYEILDQFGTPMTSQGGLSVTERNNMRWGRVPTSNATWRTPNQIVGGQLDDFISVGSSGDSWQYQTFTGTTSGMTSSNILMVVDGSSLFTVLGIHSTQNRVNINGNDAYDNGKPRWCSKPDLN